MALNRIRALWLDRAERAVWLAFLFALAWQTRVILWQADMAFIEWRAITLHATDILLTMLWAGAVVRAAYGWRPHGRLRAWDTALIILALAATASVSQAVLVPVAWAGVVRLLQGILLYAYVRWYASERFEPDVSVAAFVVGAFAQACLGIGQFVVQHDLGIRLAGETLLNPMMRGVAVFYDLAGEKTLRAYGTLPHPNVLAAMLVTAMFGYVYLYLRHASATVRRSWIPWVIIGAPLVWALAATFSRTVVAATVIAVIVMLAATGSDRVSARWPNISEIRKRIRALVVGAFVAMAVFTGLFWPQVLARAGISSGEEAVVLRVFYNDIALNSGTGLFGVNWKGHGIGQFVSWLREANPHLPAWQYQPAHDLYLLVYTEIGIVGAAALAVFIVLLVRAVVSAKRTEPLVRWGLVTLMCLLVFIALFDHFTWTLQQGRMLWWLVFGAAAAVATRRTS